MTVLITLLMCVLLSRNVMLWLCARRRGGTPPGRDPRPPLHCAAVLLVALVLLAVLVRRWPGLSSLDQALNGWFAPWRNPWLLALFNQITSLGTVIGMSFVVVIASTLTWAMGRRDCLTPFWLAALGAELTTWALKYGIDRARPNFINGISEHNPSFPSGHATASTVVLGFIAYIVTLELETPQLKREARFWFAVAIAAICFSRLFLSLHYLTDVLAGMLVGGLWISLGIALHRWQQLRPVPAAARRGPPGRTR